MDTIQSIQRNGILAASGDSLTARMAPQLQAVNLHAGQVIHETGSAPRHVFFPVDCVLALEHGSQAGKSTGIALVGNDGLVSVSSLVGADSSPARAVVHVAGWALRMDAAAFHAEFERDTALRQLVLRYALALMTQLAQTAFCYRHHSVLQQVCRWTLMSLDRLPAQSIHVTHEHVAQALGVRREGVTEAIGKLQRGGIIQHRRGCVQVVERSLLERSSCECYAAIAAEYARLLPGSGRSGTTAPLPDSLKTA
jgi:CRP-like cAMP-binding protein